jgi:hypothetical protein
MRSGWLLSRLCVAVGATGLASTVGHLRVEQ